ncbi:polyprenyl synthetase family protein [Sphaerimonospora thailandensis]|uniref:Geranylgeranyl pyrophosphate synthase n=1 Tax=Sphaerimonospora thailandensis TaxID=795644 RepID=A0A8J3R8J7_9ACTN|nr:polyprenyl synthetase family protein [Sphaerimonospora thailandensis]GIH71321.1 geranylgeranyl pyrophosphate synthase [Sphaerimonospora thailandensis]
MTVETGQASIGHATDERAGDQRAGDERAGDAVRKTPQDTPDEAAERVRALVDRRLALFLDEHSAPVADPEVATAYRFLRNFILGGGKRVRPLLCYWGWRGAGGGDHEQIITVGAALELCHSGLLIHDDIMDGSELRRGRPALHRSLAGLRPDPGRDPHRDPHPDPRRDPHPDPDPHRDSRRGADVSGEPAGPSFGQAAAILLGTLTLAWSDELLSGSGAEPSRLRAAHVLFDRLRTEVIAGQYLDILAQSRGPATVEEALTVVRYKTAKYTVERPLQIGGALAGAAPSLLDLYSRFGLPLGEAFQLRDDVLGMFGDPAETGKPVLDDLREGKHTLLMAHARQRASGSDARHLSTWHGNPELTEERAAELRQIVIDTGALAHVETMIGERAGEALRVLAAAPIEPYVKEGLAALTDRLVHRSR